eukprot:SAG31_NODE_16821_length_694_cov_1.173109_1_plen_184_part_00
MIFFLIFLIVITLLGVEIFHLKENTKFASYFVVILQQCGNHRIVVEEAQRRVRVDSRACRTLFSDRTWAKLCLLAISDFNAGGYCPVQYQEPARTQCNSMAVCKKKECGEDTWMHLGRHRFCFLGLQSSLLISWKHAEPGQINTTAPFSNPVAVPLLVELWPSPQLRSHIASPHLEDSDLTIL